MDLSLRWDRRPKAQGTFGYELHSKWTQTLARNNAHLAHCIKGPLAASVSGPQSAGVGWGSTMTYVTPHPASYLSTCASSCPTSAQLSNESRIGGKKKNTYHHTHKSSAPSSPLLCGFCASRSSHLIPLVRIYLAEQTSKATKYPRILQFRDWLRL